MVVDVTAIEDKTEQLSLWKAYLHQHHYLSSELNMASNAFLVRERATRLPVAFLAIKVFPGLQHCECHKGKRMTLQFWLLWAKQPKPRRKHRRLR